MIKLVSAVACAAVVGVASPALAQTYDCTVTKGGASESWAIPQRIVVVKKGDDVSVIDGLIQDIVGKPIPAKIETNNDKRISFTWTVKDVPVDTVQSSASRNARFSYRLTYLKQKKSANISMKPVGFANTFRAKGKCKVK
ncbi:hypothetical protein MN186_02670 [Aliiroseovarius sp. N1F302]|nr:hypothetical protein [Aliiroseovarius sediminis]MCI2393367.1 hypothetical protein [Aliiroseovarius sediminis]